MHTNVLTVAVRKGKTGSGSLWREKQILLNGIPLNGVIGYSAKSVGCKQAQISLMLCGDIETVELPDDQRYLVPICGHCNEIRPASDHKCACMKDGGCKSLNWEVPSDHNIVDAVRNAAKEVMLPPEEKKHGWEFL